MYNLQRLCIRGTLGSVGSSRASGVLCVDGNDYCRLRRIGTLCLVVPRKVRETDLREGVHTGVVHQYLGPEGPENEVAVTKKPGFCLVGAVSSRATIICRAIHIFQRSRPNRPAPA
jgi:hypothetical protein